MQSDMTDLTADEVTDARRILDEKILKAKQQLDGVCKVILALVEFDHESPVITEKEKDFAAGYAKGIAVTTILKSDLQKDLEDLEQTKTIFDSILGKETK